MSHYSSFYDDRPLKRHIKPEELKETAIFMVQTYSSSVRLELHPDGSVTWATLFDFASKYELVNDDE